MANSKASAIYFPTNSANSEMIFSKGSKAFCNSVITFLNDSLDEINS